MYGRKNVRNCITVWMEKLSEKCMIVWKDKNTKKKKL